ncbi:MAG: glycosyltransferase [Lentisphaeria bacterium]|nr:glycosyltransferase [Lentisphaeria bacterium]
MKKILAIDASPIFGGAQLSFLSSLDCLQKDEETEVILICAHPHVASRASAMGIKVFHIEALKPWGKGARFFGSLYNVFYFRSYFNDHITDTNFSLILLNGSYAVAAASSLRFEIPKVVFIRDRIHNTKLEKHLYSLADYCLCISKFQLNSYQKLGLKKPMPYLLYNGIQVPKAKVKKVTKKTSKLRLLILADWVAYKRHELAYEGIEQFCKDYDGEVILEVIGRVRDVVGQQLLNAFIEKSSYGPANLEIKVERECDHPYPNIRQCDILVVTAEQEPFGRSIVEAMHLHKAVVAVKDGAFPELLGDYDGIKEFCQATKDSVAEAIKKANLALNENKSILDKNRRFTIQEHQTELQNIIKEILHETNGLN